MNKYNNPRLLNAVVSGTGMKHPTLPHVVVGDESNGFIRGDLMDANAIVECINSNDILDEQKIAEAVASVIGTAPENLDTLGEVAETLTNMQDPTVEGSLANKTESNSQAIEDNALTIEDNELTIAAALNDLNSRLLELVTRVSALEEEINALMLEDGLYKYDLTGGSGVQFACMEVSNGNVKVYADSTDAGSNINVYGSTGTFTAANGSDNILTAISAIADTYDNFGTIEKMVKAGDDLSDWANYTEITSAE